MYNKRILGGDANEGVNNHITDSISTGDTPYSIIGGATDGATGGANGKERKRMYKKEQCSPGDNDVDGSCLDGRDITTKIMPNAIFKFFITAHVNVRAKRRFIELKKMKKSTSFHKVLKSIKNSF